MPKKGRQVTLVSSRYFEGVFPDPLSLADPASVPFAPPFSVPDVAVAPAAAEVELDDVFKPNAGDDVAPSALFLTVADPFSAFGNGSVLISAS